MLKSLSLTQLSSLIPHTHAHRVMFSAKLLSQKQFLTLYPLTPFAKSTLSPCLQLRLLSTNPTPYPLQYEMIINRPDIPKTRRRPVRPNDSPSQTAPEPDEPTSHSDPLHNWVHGKLASEAEPDQPGSPKLELDKAQRKYYNKRRKRMYGSDSDEENRRPEEKFVELKPEVVELPTLHRREEELYFYDAFAYPWEKEKHYKMVYQLEKKYFPDQCLDKAFLQPGQQSNSDLNAKGLKKVPNKDAQVGEPFLSSRRTGLPPIWDSPHGTVLLVNKPKGWTSFTVCGKLRRLVKVKK
ncbi:tRNA uridine synthase B, partial [Sesbania bispinosa]